MPRRTAEEVEQLLRGFQESKLSRQEYCQRAGVPVTTLDYYRQRTKRKESASSKGVASRLVQVKLEACSPQAGSGFTLILTNGRRIKSGWDFVDAEMGRLIRIVEAV